MLLTMFRGSTSFSRSHYQCYPVRASLILVVAPHDDAGAPAHAYLVRPLSSADQLAIIGHAVNQS